SGRMRDRIPRGDELIDGALKGGEVGEGGRAESFASEDAKPWLHGGHPRTVDRREVGTETRVGSEPRLDELAMLDRHGVGEQGERGARGGEGLIEALQEGELLELALATGGDPVDRSGAGVEG